MTIAQAGVTASTAFNAKYKWTGSLKSCLRSSDTLGESRCYSIYLLGIPTWVLRSYPLRDVLGQWSAHTFYEESDNKGFQLCNLGVDSKDLATLVTGRWTSWTFLLQSLGSPLEPMHTRSTKLNGNYLSYTLEKYHRDCRVQFRLCEQSAATPEFHWCVWMRVATLVNFVYKNREWILVYQSCAKKSYGGKKAHLDVIRQLIRFYWYLEEDAIAVKFFIILVWIYLIMYST